MLPRKLGCGSGRCWADVCEAQERGTGSERVFGAGVDAHSRAPSTAGEACTAAARGWQRWCRGSGRDFSGVVRQWRPSVADAVVAGTETPGRAIAFLGDA